MNDQNTSDQFPNELTEAIRTMASLEVPTDAVQRLIADSCKMAATQTENDAQKLLSRKQFYVLLLGCLVAFLTPLAIRMLGSNLNFLPGWDQPSFRGAFTGLASICLCCLTWSLGQHFIGIAPKRKSVSRVRWVAQIATLILCGWLFAGIFAGQGNLYAQMREAMANVNTIQYVMTMIDTETGDVTYATRYFIQHPNFLRTEREGDEIGLSTEIIMDMDERRCLMIDKQQKTAEFLPMYQIDEMQKGWKEMDDFLRGVNPEAKLIGESTIDGRECQEFEVHEFETTTIISIDKSTSLPVQMKMTMDNMPQFSTVLNQFVFDEPIDPELFSMEVPADYAVTEVDRKEAVDDSELELVPGERIGSAKFGMTVEQVIEQLGEPDQISEFEDTLMMEFKVPEPGSTTAIEMIKVCTLSYASRGFSVRVEKELGMIGVQCLGQSSTERIFQGQIGSVRMGDSRDAVQQAMGVPSRKPQLVMGEQTGDLVYELENGTTIHFTFGESKLDFVNTYRVE